MRECLVTKQSVVYLRSSGNKKAKMEGLFLQTSEPSILSKATERPPEGLSLPKALSYKWVSCRSIWVEGVSPLR